MLDDKKNKIAKLNILILFNLLHLLIVLCFLLLSPPLAQSQGEPPVPDPVTLIVGDGAGDPGSIYNSLDISIENTNQIEIIQMLIEDVDDYLTISDCVPINRASDFDCFANEYAGGAIIVLANFNPNPLYILPGTGPIVSIKYDVSVSAPAGECRDVSIKYDPADLVVGAFFPGLIGFDWSVEVPFEDITTVDGQFCFDSSISTTTTTISTGTTTTSIPSENCLGVSRDGEPATGTQGEQDIEVVITGGNTSFLQGVDDVIFENPDITVDNFTVLSDTEISASIDIAYSAPSGRGDVTVTTVTEEIVCYNAFEVLKRAYVITGIRKSNPTSASFTVSWLTDADGDGEVHYSESSDLSNPLTAYDDKGISYFDDTHHVTIDNLEPETTYYYEVVSGSTIDDNDGLYYSFQTMKIPSAPPPTCVVYGRVYQENGITPVENAIVYLKILHGPEESYWISTLTNLDGAWVHNLGNLYSTLTDDALPHSTGDPLLLELQGGNGRTLSAQYTVPATCPLNIGSITLEHFITLAMELQIGFNLIALPFDPMMDENFNEITPTAYSLIEAIPECSQAFSWNPNTQSWLSATDIGGGVYFGDDFPIEAGKGYFLKCTSDTTSLFYGKQSDQPLSMIIEPGFNLIAIPYPPDYYTACSLIGAVPGCSNAFSWDPNFQRWLSSIDVGICIGDDFTIEQDRGYVIQATAHIDAWVPGVGVACSLDSDCDDNQVCTDDACVNNICEYTNNTSACDDGIWCTGNDVCSGGVCEGTARDCSAAGDQCHYGICNENLDQCVPQLKVDGADCDDGLFCTVSDQCLGGVCSAGSAIDCSSAGDQCNDGVCDEISDQCVAQPKTDGTICDNGSFCTVSDQCTGGICNAGPARDCSAAGDECTFGVCDDNLDQCVAQPIPDGTWCDDGLWCTENDLCSSGVCGGTARDCSAAGDACNDGTCDENLDQCVATQPKVDGTLCDDGLWCTEVDFCTSGVCGGTARDCSAAGNQCNDGVCNDNLDQCVIQPKIDGESCDDGLWCTEVDFCTSGVCGGLERDCSAAGDACNDGVCDDNLDQCITQLKPDGIVCDDGLYCTQVDECQDGQCMGSGDPCPDDGLFCNGVEYCDEDTGAYLCGSTGDPCDPSLTCNEVNGQCDVSDVSIFIQNTYGYSGSIIISEWSPLDPVSEVHADVCNADQRPWLHIDTNSCSTLPRTSDFTCSISDLGNGCVRVDLTTDSGVINAGGGGIAMLSYTVDEGAPLRDSADLTPENIEVLDDTSAPLAVTPIPGTIGECQDASHCDDNNVCTDDVCVSNVCQYTNNTSACDDDLWCTENDVCSGGACGGTARDCSTAGNQCNDGVCDDNLDQCVGQLKADGAACDDGLFCTVSSQCIGGACNAGPAIDCSSAGDQCNDGVCDENLDQCIAQPITDGTICNNGLFCTVSDQCIGGICNAGPARDCSSAGDQCNDGACDDNLDQCVAQPITDGTSCDDALWCTINDLCSSGACGGTARDCSAAGDQCNDGACDDNLDQCVAQPITDGTLCDDALWCTEVDFCTSGVCGGLGRDCSAAGDECNDGVCDDNLDQCLAQPKTDGTLCDDGLYCSVNDQCAGGVCSAGSARDCSAAGDECNDGACDDNLDQCVAQPKTDGTICDDGLYCTEIDSCSGGICGGSARDCSAVGDECNDGVCDDNLDQCGIQPKADGSPCDDGVFCNGGDTCSGGNCSVNAGNPCPETECNTCQEDIDNCFDPAGTVCTDDGIVCTDDECDGAGVCAHPYNNASCNDSLYCTQIDECQGGQCIGRADPCIDNGDFCDGVEYCDEVIGDYLCSSMGDPCDLALTCDEDNDVCDASDVTLIIADAYGYSGTIDIDLDNSLDFLSAVHLDVCDRDQRTWLNIDTNSCSTTTRSSGFSCAISDLGGGCVGVDLTVVSSLIDPGIGTIAQLSYTLDATAPPGEFADLNPEVIDVRDEFDNPLTFTPVPGSILVPIPPYFIPVATTSTWMDLWGSFMIDGIDVAVGDEVGVFVDNDCFGVYKVDTPGFYGFLPVYGDDPGTPEKDGADPGDLLTIKIWDSSVRVEDTLTTNDYTGPDPLIWINSATEQVNINADTDHFKPVATTPTWMDMWGSFMIEGVDAAVGDEVGVFVDNDCFGVYKVDTVGWYGFLPVYGDDPGTPEKDGADPGDLLTIKIWDNSAGIEYTVTIVDYIGPDPVTWVDGDVVQVDIDVVDILARRDNNLPSTIRYICMAHFRDNSDNQNVTGLSDLTSASTEHRAQELVLLESSFEDSPYNAD